MQIRFLIPLFLAIVTSCGKVFPQTGDTINRVSLLFIGDIMGHDDQITSALNDSTGQYCYEEVFRYIREDISEVDFAIGNLEVTLAGEPYSGYPEFSSPDALAYAAKKSGINVLVTANNHSCDRGKKGILRTIHALDSLNIMHTGTFSDSTERLFNHPLILEKNGIRIGLLNYTYGTNGIPVPYPTQVNLIDTNLIKKDVEYALTKNPDVLIAFMHWGTEYQFEPDRSQKEMAAFLFSCGVPVVIGSHPHYVQHVEWEQHTEYDRFVAYSLGNFVSNQRTRPKDGGMMVRIALEKSGNTTRISDAGYVLTWVYRYPEKGKYRFHVLPCHKYEDNPDFFQYKNDFEKMNLFIKEARNLLEENNIHVHEHQYSQQKGIR